jgi:hypothetical protein
MVRTHTSDITPFHECHETQQRPHSVEQLDELLSVLCFEISMFHAVMHLRDNPLVV